MTETADRVVVVTGGSRGIGRAICTALSAPETVVYFNYSSNSDAAEATAEAIREAGGKACYHQVDVASTDAVADYLGGVIKEAGRIDVLVNNAGITRDGLLVRMKESDWDAVLDVNLKGAFNCMKAAGKAMMKQRYGRIINITSVVGAAGNPGQANYVAAKAGIIGLTKAVAKELASRNITVNAVAPGYIATDMTSDLGDKAKAAMISQIPLARIGTPEDVAAAVAFLASPAADYITGQVIHVSGGMYM
ncbi:3-oxoacyl-[acyl-carrier-protein] reductase [Desulfosarcina ovata]|uniref:3-oxoacyl-[acyl-carrier-protein] reductase n=1 Tax=Desulfosarcina ovata subsp. ovata TaxID=2752305 RepID=A0A5K8AEG0_9BACT|nr:3-oxoacyl-[acyl-carrier-protein] reductase [Desulfosarcina ovata]BBO90941.1 beta-ketoacyl-ACP reductase [Desulfosarcina ovata subsp. ovata]